MNFFYVYENNSTNNFSQISYQIKKIFHTQNSYKKGMNFWRNAAVRV